MLKPAANGEPLGDRDLLAHLEELAPSEIIGNNDGF
jgi:hypothetical protein